MPYKKWIISDKILIYGAGEDINRIIKAVTNPAGFPNVFKIAWGIVSKLELFIWGTIMNAYKTAAI